MQDESRLRTAVQAALNTLQDALNADLAEFPKMMYHADQDPQQVDNAVDQKKLEDQGWSTEHDPASGQSPRAFRSGPEYPKYFRRTGSPDITANTFDEAEHARSQGFTEFNPAEQSDAQIREQAHGAPVARRGKL